MYCEKCGTKNEIESRYCYKCGHKLLEVKIKKPINNNMFNRFKIKMNGLSKKNKIIMGIVLVIVIIAIIVLFILLNKPLKKIEDGLENYYSKYSLVSDNKDLGEMQRVIKSNRNNTDLLEDIKKTINKHVTKWVKNFNTSYKTEDEINNTYDKVNGALTDLYNAFNGVLDFKTYSDLKNELNTMYYSKIAYLNGKSYEDKKDNYYAYYYYQKVDKKDSYYKNVKGFIDNYLSDEVNELKLYTDSMIDKNGKSDKEILNEYLEQLDYIKRNKRKNNIDLSTTDGYKNIYNEAVKNIEEYTNKVVNSLNQDENTDEIIDIINVSLAKIDDSDNKSYKNLEKLKENYENKKPISLVTLSSMSYSKNSSYANFSKNINNKDYKSYISFKFKDKKQYRSYELDKKYKKFNTSIVLDNLDDGVNGYIVVYGDDKELYRSKSVKEIKDELKIEIDVTNVNEFRIELVVLNENSSDSVYLVEPYLYK